MLANGATLGFRVHGGTGTTYTDLPGLKEIPEMGMDPELVENTCLTDSLKQYEMGIGDAGDMQYVFKYVNDARPSSTVPSTSTPRRSPSNVAAAASTASSTGLSAWLSSPRSPSPIPQLLQLPQIPAKLRQSRRR